MKRATKDIFPLNRLLTAISCSMLVLMLPAAAAPVIPAAAPAPHTVSQTQSIPPAILDKTISETISQPEYRWRLPRQTEAEQAAGQNTFWIMVRDAIRNLIIKIGKFLKKISDWLDKLLRNRKHDNEPVKYTNWQSSIQVLLFTLIAATASALAIILLRIWKKKKATQQAVAAPVAVVPDIADENVTADQLPSDEWMNMAHELLGRGELRLALRAMFLASLVNLAYRERLTIAKYKSNREYLLELERRAHDRPDLLGAFSNNVSVLERIWYGRHIATMEIVTVFTSNLDMIFEGAKEQQNTMQVSGKP